MAKKIIAVDVDDTILDENTGIRLYMNDTHGFKHTEEDYLVPGPFLNYWENIWQLDPHKTRNMYDEFAASTYKQNLKPIKDAVEVLGQLKKDYELVIITARDQQTVEWTHESLSKYYPGIFKDVHFVSLWDSDKKATKARIALEVGASYLIDDCYEHCELVADAGLQAILFGVYGWNRTQDLPERMTRCKDWQEVDKFFKNETI